MAMIRAITLSVFLVFLSLVQVGESMKKKSMCSLFVLLVTLFLVASVSESATYSTIALTGNDWYDMLQDINGNYVVWIQHGGSGPRIMLYNGTSTIEVPNSLHCDAFPRVNANGHVVWSEGWGNETEIFLYDGTSTTQITNNDYYDGGPDINDNDQIVWQGGPVCPAPWDSPWEIFLYDGDSITQLTNNDDTDSGPRIDNAGQVVWSRRARPPCCEFDDPLCQVPRSSYEICLYDGNNITQLTNNDYYDSPPKISDNGHVVWYREINGSLYELYLYDGTGTSQISNITYTIQPSQINVNDNGLIVWDEFDGTSWEIFLYDGNSIVQITNDDRLDRSPYINDNGDVVWSREKAGCSEIFQIFLYDGTNITQITDNGYAWPAPMINEDRYIFWDGKGGFGYSLDKEIFMAFEIPEAAFTANTTSGMPPLTVQFTDQSTGPFTSWFWDFGDGGTSTQQNPIYVYTGTGSFTVSLTVTGSTGSDTETKLDYIQTVKAADFVGVPTSGKAPLNVQFVDHSIGEITDWFWDFGDGGTSTQQSPSYTYIEMGDYTVSLTVTRPIGQDVEVKDNYIHVFEKFCVCDLTPDAAVIPRGGTLGFQATVTNNTALSGMVHFVTFLTPPPPDERYPASGWLDHYTPQMTAYGSKSGHISHTIPIDWPLGTYIYHSWVGQPGPVIYDECQFQFEVVEQ